MLPKVINCPSFDVDSNECPKALRLVLREQIRGVFTLRREFESCTLSNIGIDVLINQWWKNHSAIIRAASIRPEWKHETLSLVFDEIVMRPVDFYKARTDYLTLLARPFYLEGPYFSQWKKDMSVPVPYSTASNYYLGINHTMLYRLYMIMFNVVILEDKIIDQDTVFTNDDANLSKEYADKIKSFIDEHTEEKDKHSVFCRSISSLLGSDFIPFNKIPKALFDYARSHKETYEELFNTVLLKFDELREYFFADVYKTIGAHQIVGDKGPVKTTLTNKLIKSYYDWLTALTIGTPGNHWVVTDDCEFDYYVNRMKNDFRFYSEEEFKVRDMETDGFKLVKSGTFEQMFARLQESVRGTMSRESFIVSFHPCDMITCSLGYNWSSCQSFVNKFNDFPEAYGRGFSYNGTYNRGNFQFLCGNGFIAYVPYEKLPTVPQYLWAKQKRCLLWVSNELNCMRQNFFYPGRPSDAESLAFAKVIREYIQDFCAPFNFSNGTIDWKSCSKQVRHLSQLEEGDFTKFTEIATYNSGRFDDPILTVSYLKGTMNGALYYACDFPAFDTGRLGNNYFKRTYDVCPICGKQHSGGGICEHCQSEMIEHNGHKVHPSDLVDIIVDGKKEYLDITELDKLNDFVKVEDGTHVPFKSATKVFMPSGIKYFKTLPDYVKQCKVCGEYFHPRFMVGDVCVEHVNTALDENLDIKIDFEVVLQSFLNSSLSFACNDTDALTKLLHVLDDKNVKWQSGKNPSEYIPSSNISRGRFLSCNNGKLIVSSQSKSSVVKLSKLFEKGGD